MVAVATSSAGGSLVLKLSGRLSKEELPELAEVVEAARRNRMAVTLDCGEVARVDRRAVRFLAASRERGVTLAEAPPCVRFWVDRESGVPAR